MTNKEKVTLLRTILPIGIKQGLDILDEVGGDIEKAKLKFCQNQVNIFKETCKIAEHKARFHLQEHNFDLNKAIESLENEQYSLTELILRRNKNKEDALYKILNIIEVQQCLVRDFWLTEDSINKLNSHQFCMTVILVWLDYEDYEGFDYSLNFRLDVTISEIRNTLQLIDFADNLEKASDRKKEIELTHKNKIDWIEINDKVRKDSIFKECNNYFIEKKSILIDTLYEFVKNNIHFYP